MLEHLDSILYDIIFFLYYPIMHNGTFEHSNLISCIVHDLSILGVAQNIQVMDSLQVDEFVHGWFIEFDNLLKVIVHYLLIGEMTCLGRRDGFSMRVY